MIVPMILTAKFELIGAALANANRARMLCVLMDGRAFTNKELAAASGVTAQTATEHLHQLAEAGLIVSMRSGRSVYHRLASDEVADLLERLGGLTPEPYLDRSRRLPAVASLLGARSCYNHIAGRLGVLLLQAMIDRGAVVLEDEGARVVESGFLTALGPNPRWRGAATAKLCLDWTERRFHLSGPLGTALMAHALESDWLRRGEARQLIPTDRGYAAFAGHFGLTRQEIDGVSTP